MLSEGKISYLECSIPEELVLMLKVEASFCLQGRPSSSRLHLRSNQNVKTVSCHQREGQYHDTHLSASFQMNASVKADCKEPLPSWKKTTS